MLEHVVPMVINEDAIPQAVHNWAVKNRAKHKHVVPQVGHKQAVSRAALETDPVQVLCAQE